MLAAVKPFPSQPYPAEYRTGKAIAAKVLAPLSAARKGTAGSAGLGGSYTFFLLSSRLEIPETRCSR